jgi:hypothetical protein
MKHELQGYLKSGQHTHAEDAKDPEPVADDDPQMDAGGPVRSQEEKKAQHKEKEQHTGQHREQREEQGKK